MRAHDDAALALPGPMDLSTLLVAVLAVSTSGPLIAATAAPALAIAFWRNAMSSAVLVPVALVTAWPQLRALSRADRLLAVAAGALLAAHFGTWVPSLDRTSVSSATALVSTQPVWAAVLVRWSGGVVPRRVWVGIAIAVAGAALITGVDVGLSARALSGDVLALLGAMFAAGYIVVGNRVRQHASTTVYTTVCYSTAALVLLVICVVGGQSLGGYPARAWVYLVLLTLGAQFLGHSMVNRVLRTTSPTVVSLAILLEVPGATAIAAVWLHQHPPRAALPGLLLLLAGLAVVVARPSPGLPPAVPVE